MDAAKPARTCPQCQGRMYLFDRRADRSQARLCACSAECTRCSGVGHVYAVREETFSAKVGPKQYDVLAPCACRLLRKRIERFNAAGLPGVLGGSGFEGYIASNGAQDKARKVASAFSLAYSRQKPPRGFVLSGPVGTGKTHLLSATLQHLVLEVGVVAKYVEISLLYQDIRRGFQEKKSGGEIIGPLAEVEVLAIDELGKGRGSPFELETLDELIARRYNAGRTTLFATNYALSPPERRTEYRSSEEIKQGGRESFLLCDRVGDRIYSRLCEMTDFVELPPDTPDYRRQVQERAGGSSRKPAPGR